MEQRITVLGAGYSGLIAAKLAARIPGARVTLVNAEDRFVERVRLHQLAAGQDLRDLPLSGLLRGTGVRLMVDRVASVDPDARRVHLAGGGEPAEYDTLVYALGSRTDPAGVPGAATAAVVGGGLTGLETAAELAETRPDLDVHLVTAGPLGPGLSRKGRAHVRRVMARLGVDVREHAPMDKVGPDGVLLQDGARVPGEAVVWTTGFAVQDLALRAGLEVDGDGRVRVDTAMRSVSHPEVVAVGDAAALRTPQGLDLRMACATGLPSGQQAVRSLADRLAGRPPRPLRFTNLNQCVSLGRRDALVQFVHADDAPKEAVLTGRPAALYKEAIVRGTVLAMRHPGIPTALPGAA